MATAEKKVKDAASKAVPRPTGPLMYVGPTLRTLPLSHDRVYTEIPRQASDAMAEHPQLRLLFVPIRRKPEVELQMRRGAGAFYAAYQAIADAGL